MKKTKSQKILQWETKDYVKNVVTFVVNFLLIAGLFVAAVHFGSKDIVEFFSNAKSFLHFLTLLMLVFGMMALYFAFEERDFMKNAVNMEMLFLIVELSVVICFVFGRYVNIYLRPLALVSVTTLFLTNRRTAIFMNVIFCLIIFLFDAFSGTTFSVGNYPALLMGFTSGMIAIYCLDKVNARLKILIMSLLVSLPTLMCVAMTVIENGDENIIASLICGAASGPLTVAAFLILLPLFEAVFKKVSYFKYAELTDHKAKLIRKMIQQAPGTFNHSIVVSNIAEACATAINEDAMLARTCAYYHDLGKLRRPEFFTENQADGFNPHDDLTPELSANIIKSHPTDGFNLIVKNRLPKEIADVAIQHHGTMPILYFYNKARKFTDGDVDIMQYCYAGPKPQTKIAAIVMIADACEAAARTLHERTRENVKSVVRKIVNERMSLGQFEECEITLKELNIIMHTVVNNLTGIYHSRIEYPKVNLDGLNIDEE